MDSCALGLTNSLCQPDVLHGLCQTTLPAPQTRPLHSHGVFLRLWCRHFATSWSRELLGVKKERLNLENHGAKIKYTKNNGCYCTCTIVKEYLLIYIFAV